MCRVRQSSVLTSASVSSAVTDGRNDHCPMGNRNTHSCVEVNTMGNGRVASAIVAWVGMFAMLILAAMEQVRP